MNRQRSPVARPQDLPCPLCGAQSRAAFARHGYWIVDCTACKHRWCPVDDPDGHVARVYGDSYFVDGGAGYHYYSAAGPLLEARGAEYARVLRPWIAGGRMLDVGAASGFVLNGWQQGGWTGVGLEPNARAAASARDSLHLDVRATTLEDWSGDGVFDLVALVQVLPHFVDVRAALTAAARHVAPGGYILVEGWNRSSALARVLGRRWHEYSPPSVLHWFRPREVKDLMGRHGFSMVARGRPRRRVRIDHARSLLRHSWQGSALRCLAAPLSLLPGRLALPYLGGDLFWMLFQQKSVEALLPRTGSVRAGGSAVRSRSSAG